MCPGYTLSYLTCSKSFELVYHFPSRPHSYKITLTTTCKHAHLESSKKVSSSQLSCMPRLHQPLLSCDNPMTKLSPRWTTTTIRQSKLTHDNILSQCARWDNKISSALLLLIGGGAQLQLCQQRGGCSKVVFVGGK